MHKQLESGMMNSKPLSKVIHTSQFMQIMEMANFYTCPGTSKSPQFTCPKGQIMHKQLD